MSTGLSPKFPLSIGEDGDYESNKTYQELAKQNLKTLILTIPGEKIMYPDFGVGIHKYLFEQSVGSVYNEISQKLKQQVSKYLPYIELTSINVIPDGFSEETIRISITYEILPLNINDILELTFETNK